MLACCRWRRAKHTCCGCWWEERARQVTSRGCAHTVPRAWTQVGPTIELAVRFQTHGFKERSSFSVTGEQGMGDSWGELAVPYLLAKCVFPLNGYVGWVGLRESELADKARPYAIELRTNWQVMADDGRKLMSDNGVLAEC